MTLGVEIGGARAVCRPAGSLWLEAARALVVADLHLEKGSSYAARGQLLPPFDTGETLGRLEAEAAATAPRLIVLLGDSFHDRGGPARLAAHDARRLEALARRRTLVWIEGNHDAESLEALPGEVAAEADLAGVAFAHQPRPDRRGAEVVGHLHPCAKVRAAGGAVRRRCFVTDGMRLVMPAFGALAGGLNIRDPAFSPLFARRPMAGVLGRGAVHRVSWSLLEGD